MGETQHSSNGTVFGLLEIVLDRQMRITRRIHLSGHFSFSQRSPKLCLPNLILMPYPKSNKDTRKYIGVLSESGRINPENQRS
ncbi:hypothetical protein RB195_005679 [Necator americanus]|uniref:Uncharacterized protein n=1 Tax=Necator americanus TaxID=51031 RepID=A0ABR1BS57_NECAM